MKLSPRKIETGLVPAIKNALGAKYCNRILPNYGLCIAIHDVIEAGDPIVHPGHDACAHIQVIFRIVLFRPLPGCIIEGTIRSSNSEGIRVSLGFFDDILVPPTLMHSESTSFDGAEQVWSWNYNDTKLYLDAGEVIRVRVTSEIFTESPPVLKDSLMKTASVVPNPPLGGLKSGNNAIGGTKLDTALSPAPQEDTIVPQITPYRILASIAEDGLGLTRWWV